MHYDPIKDILMKIIRKYPFLRNSFYHSLDMLFLRQWYVKKKIHLYFPKSIRFEFLDAGSGYCQYSNYVLSKWKKSTAYAVDLKSDYLGDYSKYASKKYPNRFSHEINDLVQFKRNDLYDLIAAIDIMEHIENDNQVLINFHSSLKQGGKLIISTPSDLDETARFTAEHVRPGYSKKDLEEKLISARFNIKSMEFSYGKYGKLSWRLAIKVPLILATYSKYLLLALPLYYLCFYPLIYVLMLVDSNRSNRIGNGLIVVAEK